MMIIQSQFNLGQIVYLKTCREQFARMVIGITIRPTGILYELGFGNSSSWHYELEVAEEKDVLTATTN